MVSAKAISMQGVSVFYGDHQALDRVSIQVDQGEYLALIGPNGGGKTTFLKVILGLVKPQAGQVRIFGKTMDQVRGQVSYLPQSADLDRRFPLTVMEVVLSARLRKGMAFCQRYSAEDKRQALLQLEKVDMAKLKDRMVSDLSGGEFQKMLMARALVTKPRLLLLDEPTASIDQASRAKIYQLLDDLRPSTTIVLVTHDTLAVSSQVQTLACVNRALVYHGDKDLDQPTVDALYGCPVDLIAHGVAHRVLRKHDHKEGL